MTAYIGWIEGREMFGESPIGSRRWVESIESKMLENYLESGFLELIHVEEWLGEKEVCILWFLKMNRTEILIPYLDAQRLRAHAIFSIENPNLRYILYTNRPCSSQLLFDRTMIHDLRVIGDSVLCFISNQFVKRFLNSSRSVWKYSTRQHFFIEKTSGGPRL